MKTRAILINILRISIMLGAFYCTSNIFATTKHTQEQNIESLTKKLIANIPNIRKKLLNDTYRSMAAIYEGLLIDSWSFREVVGGYASSSLMTDITEEKIALFKKAASQGDHIAQNNLGVVLYEEGKIKEAKQLFQKSAKKNYAPAQYNLGKILEKEGKTQDAIKLFLESANQGLLQAIANENVRFTEDQAK